MANQNWPPKQNAWSGLHTMRGYTVIGVLDGSLTMAEWLPPPRPADLSRTKPIGKPLTTSIKANGNGTKDLRLQEAVMPQSCGQIEGRARTARVCQQPPCLRASDKASSIAAVAHRFQRKCWSRAR